MSFLLEKMRIKRFRKRYVFNEQTRIARFDFIDITLSYITAQ